MINLTEDRRERNYVLFLTKASENGIDGKKLDEVLGGKLKDASFSTINENGTATPGSLLEIVLRIFTPYAMKVNDLLPESMRVNKASLVKVCLLQHISKAVRLIPNDNDWEKNNLNKTYKFRKENPCYGQGVHSIVLAGSAGVTFTEEESEAMLSYDKEHMDTEQMKSFATRLSSIVRIANDMTTMEIYNKR